MQQQTMRYGYLRAACEVLKPRSICEIGIAKGDNARAMLQASGDNPRYVGYDVFDTMDPTFHALVGNGKKVLSVDGIRARVAEFTNDFELVEGMTQDTLHGQNHKFDFVFVDGDHRVAAIQADFDAIKESDVIVFDDYYMKEEHNGFDTALFGCKSIVDALPQDEVFITPFSTKDGNTVRLAFWVRDEEKRNALKEKFGL